MSNESVVKFCVGDRVLCADPISLKKVNAALAYASVSRGMSAYVYKVCGVWGDFDQSTIFRVIFVAGDGMITAIPEQFYQDTAAHSFFRDALHYVHWYEWRFEPYVPDTMTRRLTVKPACCEGV